MYPIQYIRMSLSPETFLTRSLKEVPWGLKAARILAASLDAVDPKKAVIDNLRRKGNQLLVQGEIIDLDEYQRIFIFAIGKAALPMGLSVGEILGSSLDQAFILTKVGDQAHIGNLPENFSLYFGAHPVPDQSSITSTIDILNHLSDLTPKDLVIILLSGGGSALLSYPVNGLNLPDLQHINQVLLSSGAAIQEINTIRVHLSRVKGGKLSRILSPAKIISLILSDVMGDPVDLISSGPTAPRRSSYQDAISVIQKYALSEKINNPVMEYLENGARQEKLEAPKPGVTFIDNTRNIIIAGNKDAVQGGLDQALREGFYSNVLPEELFGEASQVGANLANELIKLSSCSSRPACFITGGETTVTLPDSPAPGKGGRNLELALSTVKVLDGAADVGLITLATDGEDGITNAAGAVVTGKTYQRALKLGNDPDDYLVRHDSYKYFEPLDDLIKIGLTRTNVNDLCFLFLMRGN